MADDIHQWKQVAALLHQALPQIDQVLSEAHVPIPERKGKAFELVRELMLEISDERAFLVSEAHGRFNIIIAEWYRDRFGAAADRGDHDRFDAAILVHNTPFLMRVPKIFSTPADEDGLRWISFPATVFEDEDALSWIDNQAMLKSLDGPQTDAVREEATRIATLIRSIGFDLRALSHEPDCDIVDLADAVRADLQSAARQLCAQSHAGLRSCGWDSSQATEKALKLLMRRRGIIPPFSHDLADPSRRVEDLGATPVDRTDLATIPSKGAATGMRYGGDFDVGSAVTAYSAALRIVRQLAFDATPQTEFNVRGLKLQIKRPPWFEFDTRAFAHALRGAGETTPQGGASANATDKAP